VIVKTRRTEKKDPKIISVLFNDKKNALPMMVSDGIKLFLSVLIGFIKLMAEL